jgi:hypothetical protein
MSTATPTVKVATPMLQPLMIAIPCANTVHGLTPAPEAINNPSPKPKITRPKHKRAKVKNRGLKFSERTELQLTVGTDLIKNIFMLFLRKARAWEKLTLAPQSTKKLSQPYLISTPTQ